MQCISTLTSYRHSSSMECLSSFFFTVHRIPLRMQNLIQPFCLYVSLPCGDAERLAGSDKSCL